MGQVKIQLGRLDAPKDKLAFKQFHKLSVVDRNEQIRT